MEDTPTEVGGWKKKNQDEHIVDWVRELDADEAHDEWESFVFTLQEVDSDTYLAEIGVTFEGRRPGDLLNAKYSDSVRTIEEALAAGEEFIGEVEEEYNLNE